MPIYFPVRPDPNQANTPLIVETDVNNANKPGAANGFALNFLAQPNQGILVNNANPPSLAFGNLAHFRLHNFLTAIDLNNAPVFNNIAFGNFLALFDDIFLEASRNTGGGIQGPKPAIDGFGAAYKRIVGELAGCSLNIALTRRVVAGMFATANLVPVLCDYAQMVGFLGANQANDRVDYVWMVIDLQNNPAIDSMLMVESKGSVNGFQQAPLDRAVVQTFASITAIDNLNVTTPLGISGYVYAAAGMNPTWEFALIDPEGEGKDGKPIDPDMFYRLMAPKFALLTGDIGSFRETTIYGAGTGQALDVFSLLVETRSAVYEFCVPVAIADILLVKKSQRGTLLANEIVKLRGLEMKSDGAVPDRFFGDYMFSGDGRFVRCLRSASED